MGVVAKVRPISLIETVNLNSRAVSAFLLLTGLVLCLGSALGLTKALCLTEGCRLYQGYGFLGLSMHIWGALAFAAGLIMLLCPLCRLAVYRRFLHFCLWAEIVLLTWQVIYLPCSECLLVGLIWGLLAMLEMRERLSFKIWSGVFLVALVLLGKDLLHPWPVYGQTGSAVKVFFSPSCPGCRGEIEKLLAGGEVDLGRVAFYPVALKSGDYERVEAFQNVLKYTLDIPQAFQAFWSETVNAPVGWREWLTVRIGLLRNRMVLARMGVNKIPLVVSGSAGMVTGAQEGDAGECGFEEGKDCADSMGHAAQPDSIKQIGRDGFRIKGKVSQGRRPVPAVVAQVQPDQVEQSEPDMQDISSHCQQETTESVPQVDKGQDQGGDEGLANLPNQDKDSQPEE